MAINFVLIQLKLCCFFW